MPETDDNSETERQAHRLKLRWIVIGLFVTSLILVGFRTLLNAHQGTGARGTGWDIHLSFRINAAYPGAELFLATPSGSSTQRLYKQQLMLDGLQLRATKDKNGGQRRLRMLATRAGEVAVDVDFLVHLFEQRYQPRSITVPLSAENRKRQLSAEPGIEVGSPTVRAVLERINAELDGKDSAVQRIFHYTHERLVYRPRRGAETADAAPKTRRARALGKARAMIALCRTAGIPARLVTGFLLSEQESARPV